MLSSSYIHTIPKRETYEMIKKGIQVYLDLAAMTHKA